MGPRYCSLQKCRFSHYISVPSSMEIVGPWYLGIAWFVRLCGQAPVVLRHFSAIIVLLLIISLLPVFLLLFVYPQSYNWVDIYSYLSLCVCLMVKINVQFNHNLRLYTWRNFGGKKIWRNWREFDLNLTGIQFVFFYQIRQICSNFFPPKFLTL